MVEDSKEYKVLDAVVEALVTIWRRQPGGGHAICWAILDAGLTEFASQKGMKKRQWLLYWMASLWHPCVLVVPEFGSSE
ncbi:hypothetical protein D918_05617 [Trichuris suis]|nr:hypothetical protein D918_05617 [Trichuris suis]